MTKNLYGLRSSVRLRTNAYMTMDRLIDRLCRHDKKSWGNVTVSF